MRLHAPVHSSQQPHMQGMGGAIPPPAAPAIMPKNDASQTPSIGNMEGYEEGGPVLSNDSKHGGQELEGTTPPGYAQGGAIPYAGHYDAGGLIRGPVPQGGPN